MKKKILKEIDRMLKEQDLIIKKYPLSANVIATEKIYQLRILRKFITKLK